jgi:hypothetical protein
MYFLCEACTKQLKKLSFKCVHLQHVTISMAFLQTPLNLDLYPSKDRRELKNVDAEYQTRVGFWALFNHLQDYKIWDGDQHVYTKVSK